MTTLENQRVEVHNDPQSQGSTLTELITGIVSDAQSLFKQQINLVRAEFIEDLRKTRQVAQCYGVGGLLLTVGLIMLLVAAVELLASAAGLPSWASWAIVGGVVFFSGIISIAIGRHILKSYNPLPDKSFNALQETVSCLTNPQK